MICSKEENEESFTKVLPTDMWVEVRELVMDEEPGTSCSRKASPPQA